MSFRFIEYRVDSGVAEITLSRPDVLNSLNRDMAFEIQSALAAVSEDDSIRAVLLLGAGRGFCAGQDLAEVAPDASGKVPPLGPIVRENYNPIIRAIREIEKPFVCAVNGVAAGAGANLAFACDLVLAASDAAFIQSFCKVGLIPDSGGTFMLPRMVGLARASQLALLGEKITADEARSFGLVYKVFPAESLLEETRKLAAKLASQPTKGLGLIKRAFNASFEHSLSEQLDIEEKLQAEAGLSHDYAEGVKAFLEKRKPEFKGR